MWQFHNTKCTKHDSMNRIASDPEFHEYRRHLLPALVVSPHVHDKRLDCIDCFQTQKCQIRWLFLMIIPKGLRKLKNPFYIITGMIILWLNRDFICLNVIYENCQQSKLEESVTTMRQVSSVHHVLILFSSSVWMCQLLGTKKGEHTAKSRQLTTTSCIAPLRLVPGSFLNCRGTVFPYEFVQQDFGLAKWPS